MTAIEITSGERYRYHGNDPADIAAAGDAASDYVNKLVASLRAPWTRDALCIEFDLGLWFPGRGESSQPALEICGRCPVRLECLAEALNDESLDHGIRGGATANARQVMRRNRLGGRSSIPDPDRCPPRCKCDDCKAHRAETMRRWRHKTGRSGPR
jgi:hypothetical protein